MFTFFVYIIFWLIWFSLFCCVRHLICLQVTIPPLSLSLFWFHVKSAHTIILSISDGQVASTFSYCKSLFPLLIMLFVCVARAAIQKLETFKTDLQTRISNEVQLRLFFSLACIHLLYILDLLTCFPKQAATNSHLQDGIEVRKHELHEHRLSLEKEVKTLYIYIYICRYRYRYINMHAYIHISKCIWGFGLQM